MMSSKKVIVLFLISAISWSCKNAMPVAEVSRAEVKEMVTDPETTLVDVRIPKEFQEGSIDGAINVPLATLKDNIDLFKDKKQIIVFCNTGRQSNEAIKILNKNGVYNVSSAVSVKNVKAIQNEKK